uniref:Uncharacterized protein n=1 Tax=Leersia perrieri TaxID=77586 RepID=A0A0D9WQ11_9ORYZ
MDRIEDQMNMMRLIQLMSESSDLVLKVVKNSNAKDVVLSVLAPLVEEGKNVRDELSSYSDLALVEAKKQAKEQVLKLQAKLTWLQGENEELIKAKDSAEKKLAHAITLNVKSHKQANYYKVKLETFSKKHEGKSSYLVSLTRVLFSLLIFSSNSSCRFKEKAC